MCGLVSLKLMPVAEPYSLDRGCEKESTLPKRVTRVTAETGDTKTDHNQSTSLGYSLNE